MTFGLLGMIAATIGSSVLGSLLLVSLILLVFERWRLRGKGLAMVLDEFRLDQSARSGERVYVRARAAGFMGAILHAFGWERGTVLSVTDQDFILDRVGLSGFRSQYVPLSHVASSGCEFYRALSFLLLAFVACIIGFISFLVSFVSSSGDYDRQAAFRVVSPLLFWSAVLAGIFYVVYVFSKRVVLSVETFGGVRMGLSYKRSVIEGTPIELEQAVEAIRLLNVAIGQEAAQRRPAAVGR
jgi:hypothetical protein